MFMDKAEALKSHGGKDRYNWVSDFVYGGIDGAVTTFAVVAGVEGASLSTGIILVLGFANLFADGFSMAVGKYSSDKAEIEEYERIKKLEYQHLKEKPDHEREEIEEIMKKYGFKGKDLKKAVDIITSDEDGWVDMMMRHEFNMTLENIRPFYGGLATLVSFLLIGFIPLMSYVFRDLIGFDNVFLLTCILTTFALFIVGAVKSRFTARNWLVSGFETAFIGGVAAVIAFYIGLMLKGLVT